MFHILSGSLHSPDPSLLSPPPKKMPNFQDTTPLAQTLSGPQHRPAAYTDRAARAARRTDRTQPGDAAHCITSESIAYRRSEGPPATAGRGWVGAGGGWRGANCGGSERMEEVYPAEVQFDDILTG